MSSAHHTDFTRVFDVLEYQRLKFPQRRSLNHFTNNEWIGFSTEEIQQRADSLSRWLLQRGYEKGDTAAFIPTMGSPQWLMVDFAFQQVGIIIVPIHPTASPEETAFIMNETSASICVTHDAILFQKVQALRATVSELRECFHLDDTTDGFLPGLKADIQNSDLQSALQQRKDAIRETDTLAILYTSGTSGTPKGAVLSHRNVVCNIKSILTILPLQSSQRVLSFLPFSHIFERTSCFAYMAFGVEIYFSKSLDGLSQDFRTVRPFFCTSVPRTLEKMYDFLQQKSLEKNFLQSRIIRWAIQVGERYKDKRKTGWLFGVKLILARILVFNVWQRKLGGRMRYMAVGAAALQPQIARLFSAAGITTLAGYGMTEASPFISVNRDLPGMNRFGTVGMAVPGVEISLDDVNEAGEGEIMVKGPNVMQGYYKRPEMTADVLTQDGWLRTGDVGRLEHGRFLTITGRKKDIFKTSAGKYIAPQPLEAHFASSPFIIQCLVVGFNRPYVIAILVPNFSILNTWCEEQGIHWTAPQFMVHNIKVVQKMQQEVDALNDPLEGYKRVKKFILSDAEWTVEGGDLTASFKPIRNKLLEKHKAEIEKLYLVLG